MNILITGGLGFVGSNFLELIIDNNFFKKIYILDQNIIKIKKKYINFDGYDHISLIKKDIREEINLDIEVDCILHLAASGNVIESIDNPIENLNNNVLGTLRILEFARKSNISKFIFSSTGGALMGDSVPPVNELSNPRPISPYGASKLSCEGYINAYSSMYGFNSYILRFGNVFGPFSYHKKGVFNKLFDCLINEEAFKVYGDGSSSRDYIYVKDIAKAILSCIMNKSNINQNIYHLSTGKETSLDDLVYIFSRITHKKINVEYFPFRNGEVYRNFADYSKAKKELDFNPSLVIDTLLEETFNWYKSFIK